ncbi:hypothetical protein HMPREF1401_00026 [Helicobacter pylori GAM120Ai]|uniref:Uncharacterized protein n=1 Tax=Helicobacter pylori GAM120Ai TaxID=1159029 RepID=A0AAV3IHJ5_HELPX|nr:hypothetical protein HMPREF1401_00026 [Helicobacter pylori GAM120Ai]
MTNPLALVSVIFKQILCRFILDFSVCCKTHFLKGIGGVLKSFSP